MPKPKSVCLEAEEIAGKARARDYGHPLDNHERIARIWSVILNVEVTAEQVALCMIGTKLAREVHRPKRDNLVDLCGYAKCLEMIHEKRRQAGINPEIRCSHRHMA